MLVLCALVAAAPFHFVDAPLPGVRIGAVTPFTGRPVTNYRQADINGDGLVDLLLPGAVYLQRAGRFPEELRVSWPDIEGELEADLGDGAVYLRSSNYLWVYRHGDDGWQEILGQPLDWPGADIAPARDQHDGPALRFRRFVYDLDGDRSPELVDLDAEGVHLFRRVQGRYEHAGALDVLPTMTLAPPAPQSIWPESERRIVLPEQELSCRLLVLPGALDVITHEKPAENMLLFQRARYGLTVEGGTIAADAPDRTRFSNVPAHVRPCHLNGDDTLDFAGGRWIQSNVTPVPTPIYETWASLDGGTTFHIERAPSFQHFRPQCSFLDANGDGDFDLVTESTRIFESGPREAINRYLTERVVPHRVEIRMQTGRTFSSAPERTLNLDLDLGTPPATGGPMLERYQRGQLINLTGDFNGDGLKDVAARTAPGQLDIFPATEGGFAPDPAYSLGLPAHADFAVDDFNGDGLADLLLFWSDAEAGGPIEHSIAYYASRGAS